MSSVLSPLVTLSGARILSPLENGVDGGVVQQLRIDSAPTQIQNNVAYSVVLSGAAVAPTPGNTAGTYNGKPLTVTSVTGSGPWTVSFAAPSASNLGLKYSFTGYPLLVTVDAESVQSAAIPFLPPTGRLFVDLTSVATGPNTIEDDFDEFDLAVGDQIVYVPSTNTAGLAVVVSTAGVVTVDGTPVAGSSFGYRVIKSDGTWSAAGNTFYIDKTPPVITLNGLPVQSVPQDATWTDPGATAVDDNGDILTDQIVVTGTVNTATLGQQVLTYTVTDAAGNEASVQRRVYVYAASTSYADPRDQVRVTKPNNLVYLHTGSEIPTSSPKDPNSRIFKGFELLGFAADEIILDHSILINGTLVDANDTVNGLTFHGTQTNGINKVKAEISGGTVGEIYRLTLRFTTQYSPSDDRSQEFLVMEL